MPPQITLCDNRREVVDAWRHQFQEFPEVEIVEADILEQEASVLILPGNSFGFLDRGLELAVCERFGWETQDRLRETIRSAWNGEVLVGQALFQPLPSSFQRMLYAPIARTPGDISLTVNAYLAARGAFLALASDAAPSPLERVILPGLGTASSGLHPAVSARQLRYAWEIYSGKRGFGDKNLTQLARRERKLRTVPRSFDGASG